MIFDVGANIGAITLAYAERNQRAYVHSFEPTHYAIHKLRRNLELNPTLAARVTVNQLFVGRASRRMTNSAAYASWRVDGPPGVEAHETHCGYRMEAATNMTTLDDYVASHGIPNTHLLKIDTDGHELEVLAGAQRLIATSRPRIVMEICPYLLEEQKLTLKDYADVLGPGYRMMELRTGRLFDEAALARVPQYSSTDVLVAAC